MTSHACDILITTEPLVPCAPAATGGEGAVVDFLGVVRGTEEGVPIAGIEYEAHVPMAWHQLRKIAAAARESFDIQSVALHHRIGFVAAGEPSLFLRVTARHRGPAFAASQWIVERLKERVPIWKRPVPASASPPATRATDAAPSCAESGVAE